MGIIKYKIKTSKLFLKLKKVRQKMSFLYIFTISSLQRPRGVSQNVSGLYYVRRGAGYKIHMCAYLYYLQRAKVLSSVATDFGPSTSTFMHGFQNNFAQLLPSSRKSAI